MSTPAKLSAPNFSVPPLWCLLPDYQISLWSRSPRNFRPWKSISCPGSSLSLIYQQHLTHQITLPPSTLFPSQNPTLRATSSPKVIPLNCPPPEPPWHASPVLSLRCYVFLHPYSADAIYHPVSFFSNAAYTLVAPKFASTSSTFPASCSVSSSGWLLGT